MTARSGALRIAFIDHVARLSGAEIGLARLLAATDRIEATVVLAEDGPLAPILREAGARVDVLPLAERTRSLTRQEIASASARLGASADVMRYVNRLRNHLRTLRPDVVHTNSLKSGVYGTVAARLARLPSVWYLHDRLSPDYLPREVVPMMRLMASTLPSALVVPSRSTLSTVGRHRRPGLRTAVIPMPVPMPARKAEIRQQVRNVGMVGRLTSWKGQHIFLAAFAQAFPDPPVRARLIGSAVFGETSYERELREQAAGLGIADRVDFIGFTGDVFGELEELDILVHASVLPDTLAISVLEGLGAGVPVVCADAGAVAEYVVDGDNGLLHKPGDVSGLAAGLKRLAGDVGLRRKLAEAGRNTARDFAADAVVGKMVELYARLARANRATR